MLTERQSEVLAFIVACQAQGWTPTMREIMQALNLTNPNAVVEHLRRIEKKGYIRCHRKQARRIDVLKKSEEEIAQTIWGSVEIGV